MTASQKKPVIVDFWAPWCAPCKQMMPHLEKAVANANGAVSLVKINVEKYPELAEVFRVQSVPTVYAFYQGQPVDGFSGAKGEPELKAFIDKLLKQFGAPQEPGAVNAEAVAKMMDAAEKFFREEKYVDAMAAYSTVLDADEKNLEALAGIGWCFFAQKDMESLPEFINQMTPEQKAHPRIKGLETLLTLAASAEGLASAAELEAKIAKNPKDQQARYDLALQKIAALDIDGAMDALVEGIRKDREWQDQKLRKLLLTLFEALGNAHPLTSQGRRKLSAVLFS